MSYIYTHFIPENTAPSGAKSIGVYDGNGKMVCSIPLGRMSPVDQTPLYSFGLVSDIHIYPSLDAKTDEKFDNALSYFEAAGCAFCVACGDLTESGLTYNENYDERVFKMYADICQAHDIPVYELCGNHEGYGGYRPSDYLDKIAEYTGKGVLSYTVSSDAATKRNEYMADVGKDLFILVGQPQWYAPMSDEDFTWLGTTLAQNADRRCFVFVHSYIEEDSGDPMDKRENSIFDNDWGATRTKAFKDLIAGYPNVVLFHGHSHMKFECQTLDPKANYTEVNGYKSVHVPSLGRPRNLDMTSTSNSTPYADSESQGYVVDVYDDYIVLNGMDFVNELPVPIGTFKIDTR